MRSVPSVLFLRYLLFLPLSPGLPAIYQRLVGPYEYPALEIIKILHAFFCIFCITSITDLEHFIPSPRTQSGECTADGTESPERATGYHPLVLFMVV